MTFDLAQMIADREAGTPELGGWAWFGGRDSLYLATNRGGRRFVMDFVRKGMKSAQPRFQIGNIMYPAIDHLTMYEVGDGIARGQAAAEADKSVYRLDVSGVDHPDARRIARVPLFEAEIIRLTARVAELEGAASRMSDLLPDAFDVIDAPPPSYSDEPIEVRDFRHSAYGRMKAFFEAAIAIRAALSTPTEELKT